MTNQIQQQRRHGDPAQEWNSQTRSLNHGVINTTEVLIRNWIDLQFYNRAIKLCAENELPILVMPDLWSSYRINSYTTLLIYLRRNLDKDRRSDSLLRIAEWIKRNASVLTQEKVRDLVNSHLPRYWDEYWSSTLGFSENVDQQWISKIIEHLKKCSVVIAKYTNCRVVHYNSFQDVEAPLAKDIDDCVRNQWCVQQLFRQFFLFEMPSFNYVVECTFWTRCIQFCFPKLTEGELKEIWNGIINEVNDWLDNDLVNSLNQHEVTSEDAK